MARTKEQATAARTGSAQRSDAVNGGDGSRVGTIDTIEHGGEASSAAGRDRTQRAARRDARIRQPTHEGNDEGGERAVEANTQVDYNVDISMNNGMMIADGIESDNYYTVLAGEDA